MYNNLVKYKSLVLSVFKIAIVLLALFFIYKKLSNTNGTYLISNFSVLKQLIIDKFWFFIFILLLTDLNWFLEVYKWNLLVNSVKKTSFFEAFEQSLAAQTAALFTPNKIGEYGVKAFYFDTKLRKKIVGLTFISNLTQLFITVFFGVFGFYFLFTKYNYNAIFSVTLNWKTTLITLLIGLILGFYIFKIFVPNLFQKTLMFFRNISKKIYKSVLLFSALRYFVFTHQFYFLLVFLNINASYFDVMFLLFSMYFFASILPTFSIFDWAIKGSIAIVLFQLIEVNEFVILTVSTFMWVLNAAIPAVLGSLFILNSNTFRAK